MTPIAEALKKEHPDKKHYWENELKSLGIEPKRQNELLMIKRSFRHWQKSSKKCIIKITRQHMVVIIIIKNEKFQTF
jgi:hypothetical protein